MNKPTLVLPTTCTAARHDTLRAYKRHGCRCPQAREANRQAVARSRVNSQGLHHGGPPAGEPDNVAVHLAVTGAQLIPLTQAELQAAMDQLDTGALTARAIARRLGVSERAVFRHRARRRRKAGAP